MSSTQARSSIPVRASARARYWSGARREFWLAVGSGMSPSAAADRAGVSRHAGQRWLVEAGGVIPPEWLAPRSGRYLDIAERERLAELLHDPTLSLRAIAKQLGRSPATISRELRRNAVDPAVLPAHPSRQPGVPTGRRGPILKRHNYRPVKAQWRTDQRAKRPKPTKLSRCPRLRQEVESRLGRNQSPEQIASRLVKDFPDDLEMRVSHETIYLELYVQARGGLKRELTRHLRTGRALRKPHRQPDQRRHRITGMINIADRPAEATDRIIPGHWEGDLIIGKDGQSAIGTLVERVTRFTLLLHLPNNHEALTVQDAMIAKLNQLPDLMRRSLTWDQGIEMARHATITKATGINIYFCDPHSPWQRGTNENTNGLLRQYFPKGTDLSFWGPNYLDHVATELNDRPRKTLHWQTPTEAYQQLLSNPNNPPVATTG